MLGAEHRGKVEKGHIGQWLACAIASRQTVHPIRASAFALAQLHRVNPTIGIKDASRHYQARQT